ncbi:MAG TPA: DUF72 domain-containing protein [Deltaproteobacteria bacterium]|nr:DUF72 domain-containing protein [Deltaproteobacteria bacterium]HQI80149.1 DUF72 domain-containing protein [Deltaproteobacteria bacterium]
MQRFFVGTSGWNYDHWRGPFYPEGLARTRWLEWYARTFSCVEVNATFYRSMRPSTFGKWAQTTPEGFVWAVKASRFITHVRRLRHADQALELFLDSLAPLGAKLGPVLFQLPPSLAFDPAMAESFLGILPRGRRFTLEARHESWVSDEAMTCLRHANVAWCISDTAGRYPFREAVSADFAYIRLHGPKKLYASCYTEDELSAWAGKIRGLGVDTYVFFDNDSEAHAPANAKRLRELLD